MVTDRPSLAAAQARGEAPELFFFWGHTGTGVGPWVLSQWWPAPFEVRGVVYWTAEHWMMAEKARFFGDDGMVPAITAAPTPAAAKALGRQVRGFDEAQWKGVRSAIVRTGNVEKFRQHPELAAWLLQTGEAVLVEASPRDTIWGIGLGASNPLAQRAATWRGQNLLGFALMEARRRLRAYPRPALPEGALPMPWQRPGFEGPADPAWAEPEAAAWLAQHTRWWSTLSVEQREQVELVEPAVGRWAGWYDAARR